MAWTKRQYDFTKRCIQSQRQRRKMKLEGYLEADPTECGFPLFDGVRQQFRRIENVVISADGSRLFIKLGERDTQGYQAP